MRALRHGLICGAIALSAGSAAAQTRQGADAPVLLKPDPNAPTSPSPALPNTGESLSEKLDRGNGVIKPPEGVDPEIKAPAKDPEAGANMPVIRPPQLPAIQSK